MSAEDDDLAQFQAQLASGDSSVLRKDGVSAPASSYSDSHSHEDGYPPSLNEILVRAALIRKKKEGGGGPSASSGRGGSRSAAVPPPNPMVMMPPMFPPGPPPAIPGQPPPIVPLNYPIDEAWLEEIKARQPTTKNPFPTPLCVEGYWYKPEELEMTIRIKNIDTLAPGTKGRHCFAWLYRGSCLRNINCPYIHVKHEMLNSVRILHPNSEVLRTEAPPAVGFTGVPSMTPGGKGKKQSHKGKGKKRKRSESDSSSS